MKTKTTRRIFALLLACVMLMSTTVIFASAQSSQDGLPAVGLNSIASTYASYNTDHAISAPSVSYNDTQYNMVVFYDWAVGTGGDKVALGYNWQYYTNMGTPTYREYEFTDYVGTNHCDPDYFLGKSYYSLTNTYSYDTASLEHPEYVNGVENARYGYNAKYPCVGKFNINIVTTIPTSYDQTNFIWDHNAGNRDVIKATIAYNGSYADIEVKIPLLGYNTSSVTVGGQTFYLRTGPNRCSIKAANSGLNSAYLDFAFGIQDN